LPLDIIVLPLRVIRPRKGAEILMVTIVDDHASFRNSMRRLVESFGYRTMAFKSARQFLASKSARSSACLILDVHMPRIDGFEVTERLLLRNSKLPIVLQSGNVTDSDIERARALGALLLQKPVHAEKLRRTLERLCHRIRKKKRPQPKRPRLTRTSSDRKARVH